MKRVAIVFALAVFTPSLVLALLALRSLRDQQFVLERQQALLYQGTADGLAKQVDSYLAERQREFALQVEALIEQRTAANVAANFDTDLTANWRLATVGFVVSVEGSVLAPPLFSRAEAKNFRLQNDRFLCNQESAEVYWQNSPFSNALLTQKDSEPSPANQQPDLAQKQFAKAGKRNVTPQQQVLMPAGEGYSKVASCDTAFRQVVGQASEGKIARFLQDQLHLLLWYRSPRDADLIFGAQLDLDTLKRQLADLVRLEGTLAHEICVALLDDKGQPVATSHPAFRTNWKRPFVATEIGEALPHWEMAIYHLDPRRLHQSVQAWRLTLGSLIALLVGAIAVGGWLIVRDLRRELLLARQKTDFVSNVSHELKTPLTSIRMFSELLLDGRIEDSQRQKHFLHIITAEAGRLTRLINNVLDFARMERGEKKYAKAPCDLAAVVREVVATYRPHLENSGFKVDAKIPENPVMVDGDCDALSQVVLNLLSNAEKYSGGQKEISVAVQNGSAASVEVCDRGLGVPAGCADRIFDQFYRAHDSLASGVQGSGLGLTLARQIARAHGGDIRYAPREGGGSRFTIELPTSSPSQA